MDKSKPIHLDYAATTPVDPRVLQAMLPDLQDNFGNPASRSHAHGWAAEDAVEIAREHVARVKGEALVVELPRYTKNHAREH